MDYKLKPRKELSARIYTIVIDAINFSVERAEFPYATCLSCISFNEATSFCKKHKVNPPPKVIVYSCPDYFDTEEVPF